MAKTLIVDLILTKIWSHKFFCGFYPYKQGFPQVLRTWGGGGQGPSKFDGGDLSQYIGGAWGGLKCCRKIPVKEFMW